MCWAFCSHHPPIPNPEPGMSHPPTVLPNPTVRKACLADKVRGPTRTRWLVGRAEFGVSKDDKWVSYWLFFATHLMGLLERAKGHSTWYSILLELWWTNPDAKCIRMSNLGVIKPLTDVFLMPEELGEMREGGPLFRSPAFQTPTSAPWTTTIMFHLLQLFTKHWSLSLWPMLTPIPFALVGDQANTQKVLLQPKTLSSIMR